MPGARYKSRSLGFSPDTGFSSPLKSPVFLRYGAEQECSGYLLASVPELDALDTPNPFADRPANDQRHRFSGGHSVVRTKPATTATPASRAVSTSRQSLAIPVLGQNPTTPVSVHRQDRRPPRCATPYPAFGQPGIAPTPLADSCPQTNGTPTGAVMLPLRGCPGTHSPFVPAVRLLSCISWLLIVYFIVPCPDLPLIRAISPRRFDSTSRVFPFQPHSCG
jgi:hypothetical protein